MDLVIRGGTVVTPTTRFVGDVGIAEGRIAQLGGPMGPAGQEIDAAGKLVLPGGIDMHVHLTPAGTADDGLRWADDFASGSRAAAAGGVTTVGNITFPGPGEGLLDLVDRVGRDAARQSIVDFALHPVLVDPSPNMLAEIPELAESGHTSLKIFMTFDNFDARASEYLRAMAVAGRSGMLTMVHCEDGCLVSYVAEQLMAAGRSHPRDYPASRPTFTESAAVERAVAFAEAAQAPIYIVHLSSRDALEAARRARARGRPVFVETRPIYLYFTREKIEGPDGALYIGQPPLRAASDVEALWAGLGAGDVQTCCTDHAPWLRDQKLDPSRTIASVLPGVADLETLMPLLFSEGVRKGRLSLERFIELTSVNSARLFGLYPRKGTISLGADADLVLWDPELTRTVHARDGQSNADFSLYEGWEVTGWPACTLRRGEVIFQDGRVLGEPGSGKLVHRKTWELP